MAGLVVRGPCHGLLADTLDGLPPDAREVVVLRSLQELAWNEVARRMGRNPDAVRKL